MLVGTLRLKKVARFFASPPLYARSVKDIRSLALSNSFFVLTACFLIPIALIFPILAMILGVFILVILAVSLFSVFLMRPRDARKDQHSAH